MTMKRYYPKLRDNSVRPDTFGYWLTKQGRLYLNLTLLKIYTEDELKFLRTKNKVTL